MYLHHISADAPMVFLPGGYAARAGKISQITPPLQANQLYVTHRYMAEARPVPTGWQYLTVKQAADDHHRIVSFFKEIYSGNGLVTAGVRMASRL